MYTECVNPEEVYRLHVKSVHRYFYYKGVTINDVEDLVQESFFRFFQAYPDQRSEVDTRKILYVISRNVWREWVRNQLKHRVYELDELKAIPETAEDFSEEDPAEYDGQRAVLLAVIEKLNPTVKAVLTMRFIDGKTRKEIAAHLGIAEKDVHTYQKRGIKSLHKLVAKDKSLGEVVPPAA